MTTCVPLLCCLSVVSACSLGYVPPAPGDDDPPGKRDDPGGGGTADAGAAGDGDDDRVDTAAAMLEAFGDCMRWEDWTSAGLLDLSSQLATDDDGVGQNECSSCHEADGPGAFLGLDPVLTFMRQRDRPTLYKMAMATLSEQGEPEDVVPNHRYELKGQEPSQHPDYVLDDRLVQGLTTFFDRTYTRFQLEEGACERVEP